MGFTRRQKVATGKAVCPDVVVSCTRKSRGCREPKSLLVRGRGRDRGRLQWLHRAGRCWHTRFEGQFQHCALLQDFWKYDVESKNWEELVMPKRNRQFNLTVPVGAVSFVDALDTASSSPAKACRYALTEPPRLAISPAGWSPTTQADGMSCTRTRRS